MKELEVYPLSGLLMELQSGEFRDIKSESCLIVGGKHSLKKANSLFWAKLLEISELKSLIGLASDVCQYKPCYIPQFRAVMDNPELFLSRIDTAIETLSLPVISEQDFFSAMESLTVLCNLYSDFIYNPFRLAVDQGFLLDATDIRDVVKGCISPVTNPYFNFIKRHCRPVIETMQPNLIWILGRPTFSSFAMVMLSKKAFPDVHVCMVDYPSDYYSLYKIKPYLKTNELLFSIVDSILLYDDGDSRKKIARALEKGDPLGDVPNLIYIDRATGEIKATRTILSPGKSVHLFPSFFSKSSVTDPVFYESLSATNHENQRSGLQKKPYKPSGKDGVEIKQNNLSVMTLKMWPENACFWNKCTFCGINHKYPSGSVNEHFGNIDQKIDFIFESVKDGYQYFWMTDEAVPPDTLKSFADKLVERDLNIYWQVRSRIDEGFSETVCDSLAKAGLKEIRFGLESASYRILKLMNKFPDDFNLSLVEKIVRRFHERDIFVHLCIILDFPGETYNDRKETFKFLTNLKNKYPSLTFNLNRFMLDITSKMFTRYETFDITKIEWPCPSRYFLGNMVSWESENRHYHINQIDDLRNSFMREILYPWMPSHPMTPPFNFYAAYEDFKMTLLWKTNALSEQKKEKMALPEKTRIVRSEKVVYSRLDKGVVQNEYAYQVYNWDSHNHFKCNEKLIRLFDIFKHPQTIREGLELFHDNILGLSGSVDQAFETYFPELERACAFQILRPENNVED